MARALFNGFGEMLLRPHHFLVQPSLWMVAGVYGCTYAAANLIDSGCERLLDRDDEKTPAVHGAVKLAGTTGVNMSAAITKDVMFAKMFGAAGASGPLPMATVGFFALRDLITMGSAFILPKQLAALFVTTGAVEEKYAGETAQLVSPVAMQVVCSPLHLMALNFYNVRVATAGERLSGVWRTLPQTTIVRMARMAPAYGIGGVMNTSLVHRGRDQNLASYYTKPRAATEPDDAGPWPATQPVKRRRIAASYTRFNIAMDMLGDVDPASVESAGAPDESSGKGLLRRLSSKAAEYEPATGGYYPELTELVEKKLGLEEQSNPLVGLLGDSRELPDLDTDLEKKLARLNTVTDEPKGGGTKT